MIRNFRKNMRNAIALFVSLTVCFNCNILSTSAETTDVDEENNSIIIVSLGDSYSSGEGIEPFYGQDEDTESKVKNPDWLAHRSTKSWSSLLTVDGLDGTLADYKDENWFFVASSGAVTDNLKNSQDKDYDKDGYSGTYRLNPQLDIFDNFDKNTVDYVTLTFGGNDVGFSDIITTAVTDNVKEVGINGFIGVMRASVIHSAFSVPYININNLTDQLNSTWDDFYADGGTQDDIERAYSDISDAAGENAKIIVAGYPKLVEQNGKGLPFTKDQAQEINSNVTKFNIALNSIVDSCRNEGINIYFVDVENAFDGHEAYADDSYINGIIIKDYLFNSTEDLKGGIGVSAYSIHPNDKGAEAYAACVQAKIDEIEAGLEEEEPTEESEEDGSLISEAQKKLDEEVEKQQEKAMEWLQKKLEDWLNQWISENCGGC